MKGPRRALLLQATLCFGGCISAASTRMQDSAPKVMPGPDEVRVIFYRPPQYFGHLLEWEIWDREELVGIAENGGYFEYRCKPGSHLFFVLSGSEPAIAAELAGGKTYYVHVEPRTGFTVYPVLVPVRWNDPEERAKCLEEFGRCGCRELQPDKIKESTIDKNREIARKKIAEFTGARAADCARLGIDDGE